MDEISGILAKNLRDRRRGPGYTRTMPGDMPRYSGKSIGKRESGAALPGADVPINLPREFGTDLNSLRVFPSGISFYLGVDGGATKTAFALADENGRVVRTLRLGPCNPFDVGMEAAQKLLINGIGEVCGGIPGQAISAFAGISGGTSGGNKKIFEKFFERFSFGRCVNGSDAENALAVALRGNDGVVAVIGTGSVVYAVHDGEQSRTGGYGYLFDKGGNGFSIGRDCIHSALRQLDGSGRDTVLTAMTEKQVGGNIIDHLGDIYAKGKTYIASYAPLVFEACSNGDLVAAEILEDNFRCLAGQISAGLKGKWSKNDRVKMALVGGLVRYEPHIRPVLERELAEYEKIEWFFCGDEPVTGALMLAGAPVSDSGNQDSL